MIKAIAARIGLALIAATLFVASSFAQTSPSWTYGYVPTTAQWNALWASKQDYLGAPPLITTGGTMTGPLITAAPTAASSGLNLPPGVAPMAPNNGDVWSTSSSIFARINGVTYDLIGAPCTNCALTNTANVFTAVPQTAQGATTTQPGWYAQLTGDPNARVRIGLNSSDVPSLAFGAGSTVRDTFLERAGPAQFRLGSSAAASPVPQILGMQSVIAGTSNTAGANFTIDGSVGTGTGAGGNVVFQVAPAGSTGSTQNALVTALTIFGLDGGIALSTAADKGLGSIDALSYYLNGTLAAATVNGQNCALGGTCTVSAAATSITIASTNVVSGSPNAILFDTSAGLLSSITTANNGVLVTSGTGVPSISTTLPSGIAATNMALTTPSLGAATATSVAIGVGSAITSSGSGGALGSNAFTSTAYLPLSGGTMSGNIAMGGSSITGATTISGTTGNFAGMAIKAASGTTSVTIQDSVPSSTATLSVSSSLFKITDNAVAIELDSGTGGVVNSGQIVLNTNGSVSTSGAMSFGSGMTAASLATPSSNIAGSICQTSAGIFLYAVGVNCFGAGAATSLAPGTTTISPSTTLRILYDNAGVLGESNITGFITAGVGIAVTGTTNATITATGSPYFRVHQASAQSGISTLVKVTFDTVDLNVGSAWSATNHNFNPQVTGTYRICMNVQMSGTFALNSSISLVISKNGTGTIQAEIQPISGGAESQMTGALCTLVAMNGTTDTVEGDVASSVTAATVPGSNQVQLSGELIGP